MAGFRELVASHPNINLLAISVDAPEKSRTVAEKIAADGKGAVTFRLLHDEGSKTIDAYGLRDPAYEGQSTAGIPHPAVFILDSSRRVVWRRIETDYRLRPTNDEIAAAIAEANEAN